MFPPNPYHPSRDKIYVPCAFAGRGAAYRHLHGHLGDVTAPHAAVFLGGPHIGKSALLWHFGTYFEAQRLGVYVPLAGENTLGEGVLWQLLASAVYAALDRADLTALRVPSPTDAPDDASAQAWFTDIFLPEVLVAVRPHRQVVLLLDDAEALLDEAETVKALSDLLAAQPQFAMALTLMEDYELELPRLQPLVIPTEAYRLGPLPQQATARLLEMSPAFSTNAETRASVQRFSGGQPLLVQWFGYLLHERAELDTNYITADAVKALVPRLLVRADEALREQWSQLSGNERLVLAAASQRLYDNPLRPVPPAAVARWLAETDNLLSETTVRAALRGLEYHHLIHHEGEGVRVTVGLMQTWLVSGKHISQTAPPPRRAWLLALAVALLAALLLWGAMSLLPQQEAAPRPPAPTVTLASPAG